jgi:hypothetical protein
MQHNESGLLFTVSALPEGKDIDTGMNLDTEPAGWTTLPVHRGGDLVREEADYSSAYQLAMS